MQQYFQDRLLPFCFRVHTIRMNFVFGKSPSSLGDQTPLETLEDSLAPVCSLTLKHVCFTGVRRKTYICNDCLVVGEASAGLGVRPGNTL